MSRFVVAEALTTLRRRRAPVGADTPRANPPRANPPRANAPRADAPRTNVGWSSPIKLGDNVRIQAREGHRAVVQQLQPGMWVIAEVPQKSMEIGLGIVLAPLFQRALRRVFQRRPATPATPAAEPLALPPAENRIAPWAQPEDIAGMPISLYLPGGRR